MIDQRCLTCHSSRPTDSQFTVAPAGVMFDTPGQIKARADRILERAVISKTMPFGNKTGITDEERALLGRWVEQGASVEEGLGARTETEGAPSLTQSSVLSTQPSR